jgi:hypothetical protein
MSGGILDLVSKGKDNIIIINPTITFFKCVYRSHTLFTIQPIIQKFKSNVDFNKRSICTLSLTGDLINKITLVIELPAITSDVKFAWKSKIGFIIIDNIEIEIAGQLIDRHYGSWLAIWYSLTYSNYQRYDNIIGDSYVLNEYSYNKPSYKLFIPLQFWFNRFIGLSLPILCMQKTTININLNLEKVENCISVMKCAKVNKPVKGQLFQNGVTANVIDYNVINDIIKYTVKDCDFDYDDKIVDKKGDSYILTSSNTTQCFNYCIKIKNAYLVVDYIYLDPIERKLFLNQRHEYLIDQVLYNQRYISLYDVVELDFKFLCKYIVWEGIDAIKQSLLFNDNEGVILKDNSYYNSVQPYEYCKRGGAVKLNMYSFSSNPFGFSPEGYINLNNIKLSLKILGGDNKIYGVKFYAVCYNLLRVGDGTCSLVFD